MPHITKQLSAHPVVARMVPGLANLTSDMPIRRLSVHNYPERPSLGSDLI